VDVNPVEPVSVTGRKKNGIDIDARTASAHGLFIGVEARRPLP